MITSPIPKFIASIKESPRKLISVERKRERWQVNPSIDLGGDFANV
jgi:hypothetical protein